MTTLTNTYTVHVNAPPEKVFNYVVDLTRHSEWSGGPLKVEALTPGPIAVGSLYRSQGDLPGQKDRINELRVTQYQPPMRFAFVAKDPTFGQVNHEFSFTAADGGTRVARSVTMVVSPLMAFMSRFLTEPLVGRPMMNRAMSNLKTEMEKSSRT